MPDTKITALTAIGANPIIPATFPIPMVDLTDTSMAASGTTKKVTVNQILGAGGTATLASATITGDLTAARLIVTGGTIPTNGLWLPTTNTLEFAANSLAQYRIAPLGVFSWYDGAGGTRMTLNATGLGVGGAPELKLRVDGPDAAPATSGSSNTNGAFRIGAAGASTNLCIDSGVSTTGGVYGWFQARSRGNYALNYDIVLNPNGGNVGIGVTPAARLHVEGTGPQARFSVASASDARHEYYRNGVREGLLFWSANVIGLYATEASGELVLASANTIRVRINSAGDTISNVTSTAPTLATNSQMVFNLTSNTNLRISVRGTDGVTRTANLTLA